MKDKSKAIKTEEGGKKSKAEKNPTAGASAGKTIDEIFKTVKKEKKIEKQTKKKSKQSIKQQLEAQLEKQWKKEQKLMRKGETEDDGRRKTGEGLRLYTQDELKIGKGGNTNKCPIDCDCCF